MTSNTEVRQPAPAARQRRPWVRRLIVGTAVALGLGAVLYFILPYVLERDLREAIAEADRLDPGWRFEDMQAARAVVPANENGALLVEAAYAKMPPRWLALPAGGVPGLEERLAAVPLPQRPDEVSLDELRAELGKVAAAVEKARELIDRPRGRYAVVWSEDLLGTLVPHLDKPRAVARLLVHDALMRSMDGDADGAVRSCRAAVNAGRSIGDEPMGISQLIRRVCVADAVAALERVLAIGEPRAISLEEMQRLLATEAAEPLLLIAARSARVVYFQPLELMRTGRFDRASYKVMPTRLGETFDGWRDGNTARAAQASYLRYWTAFVEAVKLPAHQQEERLRQLTVPTESLPPLIDGLTGKADWTRWARHFHIHQARLHCAVAALAAERYRLAEHRWPETLDALVPAYLGAVPLDPFDCRPLRLRQVADGIIVYSVGPDRTDDGGKLDRTQPDASGSDSGFQLWDPARRGLPPPAE
jgi:hypothetical protein